VGTSKTVPVPVGRLFEAFVDAELRERWLPGAVMRVRTSQPRLARAPGSARGLAQSSDADLMILPTMPYSCASSGDIQ
jgi:uncharacterized protein YndB with AHSA1/START domain